MLNPLDEVKPLFKYIGGKRWLKNNLEEHFRNVLSNRSLTTYCEPFVGGMGAFLSIYNVLLDNGIKKVILNDINVNIINFYKIINGEDGMSHKDLIVEVIDLERELHDLIPVGTKQMHKLKEKEKIKIRLRDANWFFGEKRKRFNELLLIENKNTAEIIESASLLMFLQTHCFNGVYRENSRGEYNTPFNWEATTKTQKQITEDVKAVKNVFSKFEMIISNSSALDLEYSKDVFYYLDPPYINDGENENKYHKDHFDKEKQLKLIANLKDNVFVYSNHNNQEIKDAFDLHGVEYNLEIVRRKNIMSASVESRKEDKEELIISVK